MDDTRQWIEALYRETGPQLLSYLSQRLGDITTAEDILQETFAAALRQPDRVRSATSARAYLFGIARNLAATASRRRIDPVDPLSLVLAADEPSRDPRLDLVRDAITRLKPEFKEALEMQLQQELSYEEMAEALGVPVGTVRSRLHYAVNQLRRIVRQTEPVPMARKEEV
jgi:RNA polymerase sigma-70 factor (ECF subfamily)